MTAGPAGPALPHVDSFARASESLLGGSSGFSMPRGIKFYQKNIFENLQKFLSI